MPGLRVLAIVFVSLLATAVVPPAFAWTINHRRVVRAETDIAHIAIGLKDSENELRRLAGTVDVLCGPGLMPLADRALGPWLTAPRAPLAAAWHESPLLPTDPWGNCYVVNLGKAAARESPGAWVLSAGPDGIIETPFVGGRVEPAGNDIARRIQ